VQHAKVGHAQREVAVGAGAGGEEEAVARAVHGLEAEFLLGLEEFLDLFFVFLF